MSVTRQMLKNASRWTCWVAAAACVFAGMVVPTEGAAQELGDRIQSAWNSEGNPGVGEPAETTAEFDTPPQEGNLMVAISGHRVDWTQPEILNDGWNLAVQRNDEERDTSARRGLAMWYKIADPNEPTAVTTQWSEPEDDTHDGRHNTTIIHEFEGEFGILDVNASNSTFDSATNEVSTGTTSVSEGDEKIVVGAKLMRGDAGDATWTNGLGDNYRRMSGDLDAPYDTTIQDAHMFADYTDSWESTASWDDGWGEAFGVIAVFSDALDGEYYFGDHCAPSSDHEPEEYEAAAHMMLDKSGSMDFNCGACSDQCFDDDDHDDCSNSCPLWYVATCGMDTAIDEMEHDLKLGFGLFPYGGSSSPSSSEPYDADDCGGSCDASHDVDADFGNHDEIQSMLDEAWASGGTPTDDALTVQRDRYEQSDDNMAGIMVTDGVPNDRDSAIEEACVNQDAEMLQYIVGLGGETDEDYNNIQAAAAGTGCCGTDVDEDCEPGEGSHDPCSDDIDWQSDIENNNNVECYGSWQANNEEQFQDLLSEISGEIQCTFDVDADHWEEGVPDDPGVGRMQVWSEDEGTWSEVPHTSQTGGSGNYEECPDTDEYCVRGGKCEDTENFYACSDDSHCEDGFCHEVLGCVDEDPCDGDGDCGGGFCWKDLCVDNANGSDSLDEDERCTSHDECDASAESNCNDGYCMYEDDWCPGDLGDDACVDDDVFCHDVVGCDADQEDACDDDEECDGFCWLGKCTEEEYQCDADAGGGWEFANSTRDQVRLTGEYCSDLGTGGGSGEYTEVRTQLACSCYSQYEDEACPCAGDDITEPPYTNEGNACPAGEYECADQHDQDPDCDNCGGGSMDPCPFDCEPGDEIDGAFCDPDCEVEWDWMAEEITVICDGEVVTEDDYEFDEDSRCAAAMDEIVCDGSPPQCDEGEDYRPMPEICDGLDNSCDGQVGNIEQTWRDFRNQDGMWDPDESDFWTEDDETEYENSDIDFTDVYGDEIEGFNEEYPGAACYEENMCVTPDCDVEHSFPDVDDPDLDDEFEAHIEGFPGATQGCQCSPD